MVTQSTKPKFYFGYTSQARLATVHRDLQLLMHHVMDLQLMDFTIVCGHRDQETQDEAFSTGVSKKRWPNSRHNAFPSHAVDIAPWNRGIDWKDDLAFARLFGSIDAVAKQRGIHIRWGGDWDRDGSSTDQSFMDIGHIELIIPRA